MKLALDGESYSKYQEVTTKGDKKFSRSAGISEFIVAPYHPNADQVPGDGLPNRFELSLTHLFAGGNRCKHVLWVGDLCLTRLEDLPPTRRNTSLPKRLIKFLFKLKSSPSFSIGYCYYCPIHAFADAISLDKLRSALRLLHQPHKDMEIMRISFEDAVIIDKCFPRVVYELSTFGPSDVPRYIDFTRRGASRTMNQGQWVEIMESVRPNVQLKIVPLPGDDPSVHVLSTRTFTNLKRLGVDVTYFGRSSIEGLIGMLGQLRLSHLEIDSYIADFRRSHVPQLIGCVQKHPTLKSLTLPEFFFGSEADKREVFTFLQQCPNIENLEFTRPHYLHPLSKADYEPLVLANRFENLPTEESKLRAFVPTLAAMAQEAETQCNVNVSATYALLRNNVGLLATLLRPNPVGPDGQVVAPPAAKKTKTSHGRVG